VQEVIANLSQLRRIGVKFIDFTGGEPLLHRDLPLMLAESKRLGFITSITTNCLLYPKYAERLKGSVDLLHFSIDSANRQQHNKIRGVECFDKVLESIDIARGLGERPDILFTVIDENYNQLPEVYERISKKNNLVLLINPVFSYFGNEPISREVLDYADEFSKRPMTYLNKGFVKLRRDGGNSIRSPKCRAVSRVITVTPYNEILLPCYHFAQVRIPFGNSLIQTMKSEIIEQYKSLEGRFPFCQGCAINCYFEPSFAFPTNGYAIQSVASKIRYGYAKMVKQRKTLVSRK
jgi:MoaA/NifB/PqqE/SkfB family radical SAM enzyme